MLLINIDVKEGCFDSLIYQSIGYILISLLVNLLVSLLVSVLLIGCREDLVGINRK